ncbi:MAG: hypothetical protein R3D59_05705 [Paracoccaceae bacterium]
MDHLGGVEMFEPGQALVQRDLVFAEFSIAGWRPGGRMGDPAALRPAAGGTSKAAAAKVGR